MKRLLILYCVLFFALPAHADSCVRKSAERRVWKVLTVASLGAAAADVHFTIHNLNQGGYEKDPLARPFTNLPTPAYATFSMLGAAAVDWFGLKLQRSRHPWVHRFWWVPRSSRFKETCAALSHPRVSERSAPFNGAPTSLSPQPARTEVS